MKNQSDKNTTHNFKAVLRKKGEQPTLFGAVVDKLIAEVVDRFNLESEIEKQTLRNQLTSLESAQQNDFLKLLFKNTQLLKENEKLKFSETRRSLLGKCIDNFDKLSPQWQGYITLNFANEEAVMPDKDEQFNELLSQLSVEEKKELVRKVQLENDFDEYRNKQKMKGDEL